MKKGFLNNQNKPKPSMYEDTTIQIPRVTQKQEYTYTKPVRQEKMKKETIKTDKQAQRQIKEFKTTFYMSEILQFIYDVADRNQVYKCNFIHLHIPLALILKLLDLKTNIHPKTETYLRCVITAITKKVHENKSMKRQIQDQKIIQDFQMMIRDPKTKEEEIIAFIRQFLQKNKSIMMALMPYYYNYFALAVNKQIVFLGKAGRLIEYSIDYEHDTYYKGDFEKEHVRDILDTFQKKLVEKYHSKDI